jgi:hypothetical protein
MIPRYNAFFRYITAKEYKFEVRCSGLVSLSNIHYQTTGYQSYYFSI